LYVTRLEIKNFKCFEETAFELNYPGRESSAEHATPTHLQNVNLFLGGNGSGKSSVFKALVLAILSPVLTSSGLVVEYFVRRPAPKGNLTMDHFDISVIHADLQMSGYELGPHDHVVRYEKSGVSISRTYDIETVSPSTSYLADSQGTLSSNSSPGYFIVGYGANRRSERPEGYSEKARSPRYQRVAGLFEEHVGLAPFTYAYLQLKDRGWLDEARSILNSLLPDGLDLTEETDNQNRPLFAWKELKLPFNALSDGYRAFISWVWDLLLQLASVHPADSDLKLTDLTGVVVVDEVDLLLHPEWQRHVIQQVATALPNLQFMFSSHSPLVAGTLEPSNIFVLDGDKVEQYQENIYGLTANQVLTSSYFGLSSTRAPGTGTLTDLAKLTLGLQDDQSLISQADPNDPIPTLSASTRNIFKGVAAREIADKPGVRKRTPSASHGKRPNT